MGIEGESPLRERTTQYALRVVRLYGWLEENGTSYTAEVLGRQLLRSGTSVGAHYREASRARSPAELISKLEGGLQELDESAYWLELLSKSGTLPADRLADMVDETDQLIRMFVTAVRTTKAKRKT